MSLIAIAPSVMSRACQSGARAPPYSPSAPGGAKFGGLMLGKSRIAADSTVAMAEKTGGAGVGASVPEFDSAPNGAGRGSLVGFMGSSYKARAAPQAAFYPTLHDLRRGHRLVVRAHRFRAQGPAAGRPETRSHAGAALCHWG